MEQGKGLQYATGSQYANIPFITPSRIILVPVTKSNKLHFPHKSGNYEVTVKINNKYISQNIDLHEKQFQIHGVSTMTKQICLYILPTNMFRSQFTI